MLGLETVSTPAFGGGCKEARDAAHAGSLLGLGCTLGFVNRVSGALPGNLLGIQSLVLWLLSSCCRPALAALCCRLSICMQAECDSGRLVAPLKLSFNQTYLALALQMHLLTCSARPQRCTLQAWQCCSLPGTPHPCLQQERSIDGTALPPMLLQFRAPHVEPRQSGMPRQDGHLTFESFSCRGLEGLLSELDFAAQPSKDLHVHSWSCRLEMWRM